MKIIYFLLQILVVNILELIKSIDSEETCGSGFAKVARNLCYKQHLRKTTWDDARQKCESEGSYLFGSNELPLTHLQKRMLFSQPQDLRSVSSSVWISMRRINGYIQTDGLLPQIYSKSVILDKVKSWDHSEPTMWNDCIAMNLNTSKWNSFSCKHQNLPFICVRRPMNNKLEKVLTCSNENGWLGHHLFPNLCFRVAVKPLKWDDANTLCEKLNSSLAPYDDFQLFRENSIHYSLDGMYANFWVAERSNDVCDTSSKGEKFVCSNKELKFLCKKEGKMPDIKVNLKVRRRRNKEYGMDPNLPKDTSAVWQPNVRRTSFDDLSCEVEVDGKVLPTDIKPSYIWKNTGVYLNVSQSLLSPIMWSRKSLIIAGRRQDSALGTYECEANLPHLQTRFKSNKVTIFLEGVRMFLYKIKTTLKATHLSDLEKTAMTATKWKELNESISYVMSLLLPNEDMKEKGYFDPYWFVIKNEPYEFNATMKSFMMSPIVSIHVAVGIRIASTFKRSSEILDDLRLFAAEAEEIDITAEIQVTDECPNGNIEIPSPSGSSQSFPLKQYYGNYKSQPICYQRKTKKVLQRKCSMDFAYSAKWEKSDVKECVSLSPSYIYHGESKCPEGFTKEEDICIRFYPADTWKKASETCLRQRAFLPSDKDFPRLNVAEEIWLQLHKIDNTFIWDGKDLRISKSSFSEDCVTLKGETLYPSRCSEKKSYICVTEPIQQLLWKAPWCRPGWYGSPSHRHCYDFHKFQDSTYQQAIHGCNTARRSQLAVIDTKELNDAIANTLMEMTLLQPYLQNFLFWTGLNVDVNGKISEEKSAKPVDYRNLLNLYIRIVKSGPVAMNGFSFDQMQNVGKWIFPESTLMMSFVCESTAMPKHRRASAALNIMPFYEEDTYRVNLTCQGRNTIPSMPVTWFRNGRPLSKENITTTNSVISSYVSSILLVEVTPFNQGDYWCEVWNWEPFQRVTSNRVRVNKPNLKNYVLHMTSAADPEMFQRSQFRSYVSELFNQAVFSTFKMGTEKNNRGSTYIHLYKTSESTDAQVIEDDYISLRKTFMTKFRSVKNKFQIDSIDFRSTDSCPEEDLGNSKWPKTFVGRITMPENICIANLKGDEDPVIRQCKGDFVQGAFWGPVQGECSSKPSPITQSLKNLSDSEITEDSIRQSASDLQNLTEEAENLRSIDIVYIAKILEKMSEANATDQEVLNHVADTVDSVLQMDVEKLSSSQGRMNSSNRITSALESIVSSVNLTEYSRNLTITRPSLAVDTRLVMSSEDPVVGVASMTEDSEYEVSLVSLKQDANIDISKAEAAIMLPKSLIEEKLQSQGSAGLRLSFIIYREGYLFNDTDKTKANKSTTTEAASAVICGIIDGPPIRNVDPPIRLSFKLQKVPTVENNLQCVYWDYSLDGGLGGWSGDGCWLNSTDSHSGRIECNCNHLTNFAVIMDFNRKAIHEDHKLALEIITYIGCAISILGLGLTILTYCIFRKWKKKPGRKILCNLSIALLLTIIVFLAGTEQTESPELCMAMAVLLHYFLLASFCWMLIEAVEQYLLFVKVLDAYIPRFMLKAKIFAWGLPLVIVLLVIAVDVDLYHSGEEYCWLSRQGLYYAFLLPVGIIITTNFTIFILVMKGIVCDRQSILRTNQSKYQTAKMQLQVGLCILLILGLTWVFGFLVISDAGLVFQYIFCVLNSAQGFLIFIFMVVRDRTAKELWYVFCCKTSGRQCHPTLHELRSQKGDNSSENFSRLIGSRYSSTDRWK